MNYLAAHLTFSDVPSFEAALDIVRKANITYEMHSVMVDCPPVGPGGRFQTPGAIFLTEQGYSEVLSKMIGIRYDVKIKIDF